MRRYCDEALLTTKGGENKHVCYLSPHSPESKHECVCGKRWRSYPNVTDPVKKSG